MNRGGLYKVIVMSSLGNTTEIVEKFYDKGMVDRKTTTPDLCCSWISSEYDRTGSWIEAVLNFIDQVLNYRLISVDGGVYYFKFKFTND